VHIQNTLKILGAALVLLLTLASTASADDRIELDLYGRSLDRVTIADVSPAPSQDEEEADGNTSVTYSGDTRPLTPAIASLWVTGIWFKDTDRGDETNRQSHTILATLSGRVFLGEALGMRIEGGLYTQADYTYYTVVSGADFEGDYGRAGGGLEFEFRGLGDIPSWAYNVRVGAGYNKSHGVDRRDPPPATGRYRSTQETLTLTTEHRFEWLWPFLSNDTYRFQTIVGGQDTRVFTGFSPKISLWANFRYQLHTSRRTTVTRQGGTDRQRENELNYALRWHFWRFANESLNTRDEWLWEITPRVVLGGSWRYAAGYNTIRSGHSTYEYYAGLGLEISINRSFYIDIEGRYHYEWRGNSGPNGSHPDRESIDLIVSLGVNFW
jgi:hypothetical protein